jgi:EAL domain-containing protein (putative c-di-GMP-specific phosphodiesterase class I)/ActR/RegA family two-component response regulator
MIHLHSTQAVSFRVLIVDDEAAQRIILARCVEMLGWKADTAANVNEAVGKFSAHAYDVVVIDLCLGEQDGMHLLRHLRKNGADPSVIFVSGMDDRIRAAAFRIASDLGMRVAGTLAKPVDPYSLHALLLTNPVRSYIAPRNDRGSPTADELTQALLDNEIHTEYQPKINLLTGEIVGAEALARWKSPDRGMVPPEQFIPVAERSDLINKLTYRVLQDAISSCSAWREWLPNCSVAVNVSPHLLSDPRLLTEIDSLLSENRVPPAALIVEVTESTLIANLPVATEVLTRLSIKGVRISMDDFGTGYSSLQSLLRMPFTELKIDKSFVGACQTDPEAWKIVRATLSLARELGMRVVAEGIETAAISDRLRDAGCEMGQGWYSGRPMRNDSLVDRINQRGDDWLSDGYAGGLLRPGRQFATSGVSSRTSRGQRTAGGIASPAAHVIGADAVVMG